MSTLRQGPKRVIPVINEVTYIGEFHPGATWHSGLSEGSIDCTSRVRCCHLVVAGGCSLVFLEVVEVIRCLRSRWNLVRWCFGAREGIMGFADSFVCIGSNVAEGLRWKSGVISQMRVHDMVCAWVPSQRGVHGGCSALGP
jgi:hypothetical protein